MRTHDSHSLSSGVAQKASRIVFAALLACSVCPLAVHAQEDAGGTEPISAEELATVEDEAQAEVTAQGALDAPEEDEAYTETVDEDLSAAAEEGQANAVDESGELAATAEASVEDVSYNLIDAEIDPIADQTYTGEAITPDLTVTYDGVQLSEGTDYTVQYEEGSNVNVGAVKVTISGKGDYHGAQDAQFLIVAADVSDATVGSIKDQTYTGKALKPALTVNLGTHTLNKDTDYTVTYKNNTNAGTATATIAGKGNCTGTKSVTFKIVGASIAAAKVTASAQTYTGKKLTPAPTVKLGTKTLTNGTDYTVTYSANQNAGTATITVTGKGNYTGTAKGTFTIKAASLAKATVASIPEQKWDGKAKKPNPTVKLGGVTLKQGTDYTVSYKNNVGPSTTATVTITGKENYSGTKSVTFKIGPKTGEWKKSNGLWWFRYADGSYPKSQFLKIKGVTYYFDSEGWMVTGWEKLGGSWFYFDPTSGAMKTGWIYLSGTWYWLNSEGRMVTGWQRISGKWYWFNSSGARATGLKKINGKVYYLSDSGAMVTGWAKINNAWYHFDSDGAASIGWYKVAGSWYYGTESGRMVTGWKTIDNVRYYLDPTSGAMATGWKKISDRWYYFDPSSGAMAKSRWIGDYYVGINGYMYTDRYTPDGYYVDKNGKWDGKEAVKVQPR